MKLRALSRLDGRPKLFPIDRYSRFGMVTTCTYSNKPERQAAAGTVDCHVCRVSGYSAAIGIGKATNIDFGLKALMLAQANREWE